MDFVISPSHFKFEIQDMNCSDVRRVHGLSLLSSDSSRMREFYGKTYSTEIEIIRPFTDLCFFDWLSGNKYGEESRKRSGRLDFITPEGDPIISFRLEGVFPTEWQCPDLEKASNWGNPEPLERVRLAVERFSRA